MTLMPCASYLKTDGAVDYWGKRKAILALLAYFKPLAHIGHMPHWAEDTDGWQARWRTITER